MSQTRFIRSIAANIAYWRDHDGLADPRAWPALDSERENLFRAVEFGLQQAETWPAAADLALNCYTYVFERGYWPEWAPVLDQALSACPDDNSAVKANMAQQLGSFYRKLRRLDDALAAHEQARAIGRTLSDMRIVAMAQLGLGRVYLRRRQYSLAERHARQALAQFEALDGCADRVAQVHNLLGIIAARRGDYENSVGEYYRARDLFRQTDQSIEFGRTSVNMIEALSHLGRVEEALALSEEAAAILAAYDLQDERSRLYVNLGYLHYREGHLAQAEAAFRQAYSPYMRRVGPVYYRSLIEMNLGNALLQQGYVEESRTYFLSAANGLRLVNALSMLANSLDGLAETSLAVGDRPEAIALYEEALEIVTAIPEDAFANRMETRFRGLLDELRARVEEE